ncbi:NAD(P)-dependent oxidoreductase [Amycolatopsis sp. H20-H5]|uniref:NAD(P)-dependent oxidoreductase n=1 Tax=Amycolatopsis sp. H20-H5 TaxID=3046309 RepID=UPI002DB6D3B3|nr:NAD(P)-dependent oxidoreductase [Amycolatopsis sp. H20-H5]MEC3981624.1 NAD(P)-dependent oxidoreductase [Amycolatopsis sp. H20-H5]
MTTVAFLGTGIMGAPMAANLAKAGFTVRAWNRTDAKAEPLTAHGVEVFDEPGLAVAGADLVLTMLADGPTVLELFTAIAAAIEPDAVWIQSSTVGPEWTAKHAEAAAKAGLAFVDTPVLGTKQPAEAGKLTVLAGGPDELRERCAPVFDAIGAKTLWVGEAGAASKLKLVANSWVLALTNAVAETVALAGQFGLDPQSFLDSIKGGGTDVAYAHIKGAAMINGDFTTSFPAKLAAKDARLVLDSAGDADLGGVAATLVHLEKAVEAGYGDDDMAVLYRGVVDS